MSENAEDVTYMPAEQFDELVRTLDEPDATPTRWRIHNPQTHPHLYYVFTTENDANTALLALGRPWKMGD